jgi:hypothetical protein
LGVTSLLILGVAQDDASMNRFNRKPISFCLHDSSLVPRRDLSGPDHDARGFLHFAVSTKLRIAKRTCSGKIGQAVTTRAKPGSETLPSVGSEMARFRVSCASPCASKVSWPSEGFSISLLTATGLLFPKP